MEIERASCRVGVPDEVQQEQETEREREREKERAVVVVHAGEGRGSLYIAGGAGLLELCEAVFSGAVN